MLPTTSEIISEAGYRFKERIGMLTDGRPPTDAEIDFATAETEKEMRELKAYYEKSL